MNASHLTLVLRPRNGWEAVDLGFALARRHFAPLFAIALAALAPLAVAANVVAWLAGAEGPSDLYWFYAFLAVWWAKPLAERLVLSYLGAAVFGEAGAPWSHLRRALSVLKGSGWLYALSLARFAPKRSYLLPVRVLERQHGPAARERMRLLAQHQGGVAGTLTVLLAHLEILLMTAALVAIGLFVPEGASPLDRVVDWTRGLFDPNGPEGSAWLALVSVLIDTAVMAGLMPFYVAGGFALYLQRRAELEGWDVEMGLWAIEHRIETAARRQRFGARDAVAACMLVVLGFAAPAPSSHAAEAPGEVRTVETVTRKIAADPVFGTSYQETSWTWRTDRQKPQEAEEPGWLARLRWLLGQIGDGIAAGGRVLLWALALLAAGVLLWRIGPQLGLRLRRVRRAAGAGWQSAPAPEEDALPADLSAAVDELLARGAVRAALALLLRAVCAALARRGAGVAAGTTEGELLARLDGDAPEAPALAGLVEDWRSLAYAGRAAAPERVRAHLQALRPLLAGTPESP